MLRWQRLSYDVKLMMATVFLYSSSCVMMSCSHCAAPSIQKPVKPESCLTVHQSAIVYVVLYTGHLSVTIKPAKCSLRASMYNFARRDNISACMQV